LPAKFFWSPKLKFTLKDQCFESVENIQKNPLAELCAIPQKHTYNAPKSRENAGNGVLGVQGTTSKETRQNKT